MDLALWDPWSAGSYLAIFIPEIITHGAGVLMSHLVAHLKHLDYSITTARMGRRVIDCCDSSVTKSTNITNRPIRKQSPATIAYLGTCPIVGRQATITHRSREEVRHPNGPASRVIIIQGRIIPQQDPVRIMADHMGSLY